MTKSAKRTPAPHDYAVIMAGGTGTRLWPLSRQDLPKQMQRFIGDKTLINETADRLYGIVRPENLFVSTTANYADKIRELLPQIPPENLVVEPMARGTAAALTLVTTIIHGRDPEASIFYIASDHSITDVEKFQETLVATSTYVAEHPEQIVLIGIKPTRPDTGLGYLKVKEKIQDEPPIYSVEKFIEKPSLRVAKTYVASPNYCWNAAYYCFKAATLLAAYDDADPLLRQAAERYLTSNNPADFEAAPIKIHEIEFIDSQKYRIVTVIADFGWCDVGNWQSLHDVLSQIEQKTLVARSHEHIDVNSSNCLIFSLNEKLVATVGLENIVVVDTPDALLVLNKDRPQDVRKLLELLKEKGLEQYL